MEIRGDELPDDLGGRVQLEGVEGEQREHDHEADHVHEVHPDEHGEPAELPGRAQRRLRHPPLPWSAPSQREHRGAHRHQHHPVRRGDTHVGLPEARQDLERDGTGVVGVQHDRGDEVPERGDEGQARAGDDRRPQQRQGHPPKRAPASRAERGGSLVERGIQRAEAGEDGPAGDRQVPDEVGERKDPEGPDQQQSARPTAPGH